MRRSSRSHRNVDGMNRMQVTANRRLHRSLQRTCSEAFALNPRDGTRGPIIPQEIGPNDRQSGQQRHP
jgi:hypothetical protein